MVIVITCYEDYITQIYYASISSDSATCPFLTRESVKALTELIMWENYWPTKAIGNTSQSLCDT